MINWKMIIIGVIVAIILSIFFGAAAGAIGLYLGVIIAGIVVGYIVDIGLKNGATHGVIMGVIASIILTILSIIIALSSGESPEALFVVVSFILSIILWAISGAVGGTIGVLIRLRQMESMSKSTIGSGTQSTEGTKSKIEFSGENISKCVCSQCPVQAESECAQTKMKMLQESMTGMSPEPSDVPGVYCATGIATCSDIDPNKMCNCPNCEVFKENNLEHGEPGGYFCQKGMAK
jgi:hypothetical protein